MGWWAEGNGGAVGGEVIFEEDGRGRKREEERDSVGPTLRAHPSHNAGREGWGHPQVFVFRERQRKKEKVSFGCADRKSPPFA
jgi:hypothetical protein